MHVIHYFEEVVSTNSTAKEFAARGEAHGSVVWAANQTGGKGRLGKDWHSSPGAGLYCSVILRPSVALEELAKITLVTGVAVGTLLTELSGKMVMLKWPNDIYFSGRKCAGILTESSSLNKDGRAPYVVVGIGINVNQEIKDFPTELQTTVTTLMEECGKRFKLEELLEMVRDRVLKEVSRFENNGFSEILQDWKKMDFLYGKEMECVDVAGKIIRGVSLGPDGEGNLHVKSDDGSLHSVLSGDVRLAKR
jgi:BirA family biotin operon repressor/biotin-[acetyl-CoA-carboxylase] ligase